MSQQARWQHTALISDQQIPRTQKFPDIPKMPVLEILDITMNHQ
jgi:hypothetical protein